MRIAFAIAALLFTGSVLAIEPPDKPATQAATQPATQPVQSFAAVQAQKRLDAALSKLDAEYGAKKADVLRRYVAELTGAKNTAIRKGDREEAQRIYDTIQAARAEMVSLVGEARPQDVKVKVETPFEIRIRDFNGAAGYTKVLVVTPMSVGMNLENDFGKPPRELWKATLTAEERSRLSTFMSTFPLQRLQDSYVDPNVFDGTQITFELKIGSQKPRKIFVENMRQRDLENLVDEVNAVLPPKYLISSMSH